ncbi:hypothetical protein NQ314_020066 [Rhamnusium bicolor]|uniref:Uncharacterized protein n=1 Tax=Rhamnusium bicolor TaxID=1586634 RepID=A0AAV8WLW0_9CUCU|nr:hypothetical protein NQ314_020066 [Rhamnusium bicolor]
MTKRYGSFEQILNKKPKLDDDIEALWGEDLDEDALDDCIKLATQVCEEVRLYLCFNFY